MEFLNGELFAAYLAATIALILMPGPIVTLVIANSLAHGPRTGLSTVAGSSFGNALLVIAGALGLSTMLTLVADIFEWVRWAGVAYLVYLGIRHWRAALRSAGDTEKPWSVKIFEVDDGEDTPILWQAMSAKFQEGK